jgi:hypothetical protein
MALYHVEIVGEFEMVSMAFSVLDMWINMLCNVHKYEILGLSETMESLHMNTI